MVLLRCYDLRGGRGDRTPCPVEHRRFIKPPLAPASSPSDESADLDRPRPDPFSLGRVKRIGPLEITSPQRRSARAAGLLILSSAWPSIGQFQYEREPATSPRQAARPCDVFTTSP